jgi:hypothetical protein
MVRSWSEWNVVFLGLAFARLGCRRGRLAEELREVFSGWEVFEFHITSFFLVGILSRPDLTAAAAMAAAFA